MPNHVAMNSVERDEHPVFRLHTEIPQHMARLVCEGGHVLVGEGFAFKIDGRLVCPPSLEMTVQIVGRQVDAFRYIDHQTHLVPR
jgi:hypothetical protein